MRRVEEKNIMASKLLSSPSSPSTLEEEVTAFLRTRREACAFAGIKEGVPKGMSTEAGLQSLILSKQYRKWAVSIAVREHIAACVRHAIRTQSPLVFSYPFGGYKTWKFPSYPGADWAEFFAIAYYLEYIGRIAHYWSPGVRMVFFSDAAVINLIDNIPEADTDRYTESFKTLLDSFEPFLPKNISLEFLGIKDIYEEKEYKSELLDLVDRSRAEYQATVEPRKRERDLQSSFRNINWQGQEDWTHLSVQEREAKVFEGALIHYAYCKLVKRKAVIRSEQVIPIGAMPFTGAVALGSTKTTIAKFQAGFGILKQGSYGLRGEVLSYEQYQLAKGRALRVRILEQGLFFPCKDILILQDDI